MNLLEPYSEYVWWPKMICLIFQQIWWIHKNPNTVSIYFGFRTGPLEWKICVWLRITPVIVKKRIPWILRNFLISDGVLGLIRVKRCQFLRNENALKNLPAETELKLKNFYKTYLVWIHFVDANSMYSSLLLCLACFSHIVAIITKIT